MINFLKKVKMEKMLVRMWKRTFTRRCMEWRIAQPFLKKVFQFPKT
jgi:hypothetical protein